MKHSADRASATTLALGALGGVVTMVLHPTDGLRALEEGAEGRAHFAAAVHALAIVSLFLQMAGGWGVLLRLGCSSASARLGFAALAWGSLFGSLAATVSALTAPWLMGLFEHASEAEVIALTTDLRSLHTVVNACTQVFLAGALVNVLAWSFALWGRPNCPAALRWISVAVSLVALAGQGLGLWQPTVPSLAAFMLALAVWQGTLAVWLLRGEE